MLAYTYTEQGIFELFEKRRDGVIKAAISMEG